MTLTWTVVALVLFGALLHAGWNALVMSSQNVVTISVNDMPPV